MRRLIGWELRLPRPRRGDAWAALLLTGLVLLLFRGAVFEGGVFFERDIHLHRYAQVESFVRTIAAGSWPVWDPLVSFGQPMWANPEMQICYPPTWLNLLMRPWTYYTLYVVGHLLLGGLGVYYLGKRLGISPTGSLAAAALWSVSGPVLSLVNVYHHLAGAAWMPWVLYAAHGAFGSAAPRRILALGAVAAMQVFAGSGDMCLMTAVLVGLDALCHVQWAAPLARPNRRLLAAAVLAAGFALALSAAQWLPTLEVVSRSARWDMPARMRTFWSVHPLAMLQTLWPVSLNGLPLTAAMRGVLFEGREPFLLSLYLGMPAAGLVAASFLGSSRGQGRMLALVGIGAAVLALGRHSPAYDAVVYLLPPLGILRYPEKGMVIVAFAWALLAGLGFDAWRAQPRSRRGWALGVLGALGTLAACGGAAAVLARLAPSVWARYLGLAEGQALSSLGVAANGLLLSSGLALAAGAAAALRLRQGASRPWLATAVTLLAVLDLAAASRGLNPLAPRGLYTDPPPALELLRQEDGRRLYVHEYSLVPDKAQRTLGRERPFVLQSFVADWPLQASAALARRMYLEPPTGGAWGLEGSYDLDQRGLYPPYLARLNQLARAVDETPAHWRLLRLGAVGRVMALHEVGLEGLAPMGTFPGLFASPIRVYRVSDPLPRTYAVGEARVSEGLDALETLLAPEFDPRREVVLPEQSGPLDDPSEGFSGTSRIVARRPDRVSIEARLSRPGYVVLVDAHDPGWQATLDGREVELLRANVGFRAVRVPAGVHEIGFRYRPAAVRLGLLCSAAALVAGLLLWLRGGRLPEGNRG